MSKLKLFSLTLVAFVAIMFASQANAQTIGYANYKKIEGEYNYAKKTYKMLDKKALELQQYLMDKDKEFKAIESPIKKKNFEQKISKEYKAKEQKYMELKVAKEEEIFNTIVEAVKQVAAQEKIDLVLDYRVIFTGGVDLSPKVVKYLNAQKK